MKDAHMCYIGVTERKIENLKKEGKMRISILIFIYKILFASLNVYKKVIILNQVVAKKTEEKCPICVIIGAEKSATKKFIEEKENEQTNGLICYMRLFFVTQYN